MSDRKLKDTGIALACWILLALILLVFFFVKKDTIVSNLQHTNFVNRVMGRHTDDEEVNIAASTENTESTDDEAEDDAQIADTAESTKTLAATDDEISTGSDDVPDSSDEKIVVNEATQKPTPEVRPMKRPITGDSAVKGATTQAVADMMSCQLCFIVVDSDGIVSRRIAQRKLPKTTSPLTASIKALLNGPEVTDAGGGGETLIPDGTKLLSAQVRNGVATLNFSEEFAFNPVGVEGYMAQLMQVVYTATAFSTVNSVQFIINGEKVDYLGSEGEWIGSPLSRASFK